MCGLLDVKAVLKIGVAEEIGCGNEIILSKIGQGNELRTKLVGHIFEEKKLQYHLSKLIKNWGKFEDLWLNNKVNLKGREKLNIGVGVL